MFDLISLLLIFIEKSIAINIPYNFVAITYSTYLIYTRGVDAFWNILVIAFIVSLNSIPLSVSLIVGVLYFIIFYFLSTYIGYKKINLPFITLIQILVYLSLTYKGIPNLSVFVIIKFVIAYGIFNYLYIEDAQKISGAR